MTHPGDLRLFYDYVDPASYLLEQRLRRLLEPGPVGLVLEPFELVPPPGALWNPEGEEWGARWESLESEVDDPTGGRARPWIVPWSRKAHELAIHAREKDCFPEIHEMLFRAYLSEGRDIGRVDVLVELARPAGLDPMETKAVLDVDRHSNQVAEKRKEALEAGVVGAPTILWKGRILLGYPDERALHEFLALDQELGT
jgi:predicted DsbA family dithiol-disulfide isomerase